MTINSDEEMEIQMAFQHFKILTHWGGGGVQESEANRIRDEKIISNYI